MNRDPFYLLEIYQYGQDIVQFVQGMDESSFACVHNYRQINIDQVWQVTQISIPELLQNIQLLLPGEDE